MFRLTATVALLGLCACKAPDAPPPAQPEEVTTKPSTAPPTQTFAVSTDRNSYQMVEGPFGPEVTITTTIRAPRDKRVYVTNCNGAIGTGLERLVDGKWEYAWAQEMNACLSEPIIIEAGQAKTTTILAASGEHAAVDARRNSSRIEGGTYRVGWHGLYTSWNLSAQPWGEELPLDQRVSAPFTIAPPRPHDASVTSPLQRPEQVRFVAPQHLEVVSGRHPVSVGFTAPESTLRGDPQLYIDREMGRTSPAHLSREPSARRSRAATHAEAGVEAGTSRGACHLSGQRRTAALVRLGVRGEMKPGSCVTPRTDAPHRHGLSAAVAQLGATRPEQ